MTHARFAAVILSAGFSSRMGAFKPLMDLGGKSILERVISLFKACGVGEIHAVAGYRRAEVSPLLETLGVNIVSNPDFEAGMYSSVVAGVRCIDANCSGFFILPVDIPLVRPQTVQRLMAIHETDPEVILHPCFRGRRGHPPLLPAGMIAPILQWPGTDGLQGLLKTAAFRSVNVDVVDRNIRFDVDSPEEYRDLLARWRTRHFPASEECDAVLESVPEGVIRHGRRVAAVAVKIGEALVRRGVSLDLDVIRAAALLHDMAKGESDHAEAGGRHLSEMGFPRVGGIVAAHMDFQPDSNGTIGEAEVVCLADRYVQGDRVVSLTERFEAAESRFADDPEGLAAARLRRGAAFEVRERLTRRLGESPERILGIDPPAGDPRPWAP